MRAFLGADRERAKDTGDTAHRQAAARVLPAAAWRLRGAAALLAAGAKRARYTPPGAWARLRGASALQEVDEQRVVVVVVSLGPAAPGIVRWAKPRCWTRQFARRRVCARRRPGVWRAGAFAVHHTTRTSRVSIKRAITN